MRNDKDIIPMGKAVAIIIATIIGGISLVGWIFYYGYRMLNNSSEIPTPISVSTPVVTPKPTPTPEPTPTPISRISWNTITIDGDEDFVTKTQEALEIIKSSSAIWDETALQYVGIIKQGSSSYMMPYNNPPTFQVASPTYSDSPTWYAGAIIHDAYHSKQYLDYLFSLAHISVDFWDEFEYTNVPDDVYSGYEAEMECLEFQILFLEEIKAPTIEIEHAKSCRGTNWWDEEDQWW